MARYAEQTTVRTRPLSPQMLAVLRRLEQGGQLNEARAIGRDPAYYWWQDDKTEVRGNTIDALWRFGLIADRDGHDWRARIILLTDQGRAALAEAE